jgi:SHAQKYF class myb-like DNA-binding protein
MKGTSRWTHDEHALFVSGMEQWPKNWKKIAEMVQTRTATQCRTHAQKVWKEEDEAEAKKRRMVQPVVR